MMNIWVMGVFVRNFCMDMSMNMQLLTIPRKVVKVLMMTIMGMGMLMI